MLNIQDLLAVLANLLYLLLIFSTVNQDHMMEDYADGQHVTKKTYVEEDYVDEQHVNWNFNSKDHVNGRHVTESITVKDHGDRHHVIDITVTQQQPGDPGARRGT